MDILGKARKLESHIARRLDDAVQNLVGQSPRQPIEIIHAIVGLAEQQIQPAGRGRRVFPFNRVEIQVAAVSKTDKARFAALSEGPPSLHDRIIERLHTSGCETEWLDIHIAYVPKARPSWTDAHFHVEFDRVEIARPTPVPAAAPDPLRIDLTVAAGAGERKTYTFSGGRIDIGRRADVFDHRQRLVRTNHVVFKEGEGELNQSVSRRHAHIVYDQATRDYRLHDDRSAHGTAVVRGGQTIPVPVGSRGVRLRDGDDIMLGQARLRVKIVPL